MEPSKCPSCYDLNRCARKAFPPAPSKTHNQHKLFVLTAKELPEHTRDILRRKLPHVHSSKHRMITSELHDETSSLAHCQRYTTIIIALPHHKGSVCTVPSMKKNAGERGLPREKRLHLPPARARETRRTPLPWQPHQPSYGNPPPSEEALSVPPVNT